MLDRRRRCVAEGYESEPPDDYHGSSRGVSLSNRHGRRQRRGDASLATYRRRQHSPTPASRPAAMRAGRALCDDRESGCGLAEARGRRPGASDERHRRRCCNRVIPAPATPPPRARPRLCFDTDAVARRGRPGRVLPPRLSVCACAAARLLRRRSARPLPAAANWRAVVVPGERISGQGQVRQRRLVGRR